MLLLKVQNGAFTSITSEGKNDEKKFNVKL
ncbi:hypothetical protein J2Z58_002769 [Halobacillus andaensis]|nr:hypothetical protein [Halobacillus andaensis]